MRQGAGRQSSSGREMVLIWVEMKGLAWLKMKSVTVQKRYWMASVIPWLETMRGTAGTVATMLGGGSKHPDGFGLYDMHENLREWTADWYGSNFNVDGIDPWFSTPGTYRVKRGGSYVSGLYYLRVSVGDISAPSERYDDVSFRLLLRAP